MRHYRSLAWAMIALLPAGLEARAQNAPVIQNRAAKAVERGHRNGVAARSESR